MSSRKTGADAVKYRAEIFDKVEAKKRNRITMKREILELMELEGWNQARLAREIGVTESAVWRWIEGERVPGGATQKFLEKLLAEARLQPKRQKQTA